MKRWKSSVKDYVENELIDLFLQSIETECRLFGLSISHQDGHGAFQIVPFNEHDLNWLQDATDCTDEVA